MFKIAYGAGHNKFTKNRIPDGATEWVLNDRVARYFEKAAKGYPVELKRVDHETEPVDLRKRCKLANDWGADFFLSIHHNAGINGGKGGGIVVYTYTKVDKATKEWQKEVYNIIILKKRYPL